jgi:transcription elongation factor GreA
MTAEGAQKLREELQRLKFTERPRITNAIAEARALGDLKENAEYHAAREQQSFTEGRIAEIESKLATAEIIDVTRVNPQGRVVFGATVELMNLGTDEEVKYRIVGEDEADIKAGLVSINSPVARALIGKREGDTVSVQVPSGAVEYEVLAVRYV